MSALQIRKCYATELGGCSKGLSAEHFISRSILELLDDGPGFNVTGLPWQQAGSAPRPSVAWLSSKILCVKHNTDLSALDAECLKLFNFFEEVNKKLTDAGCSIHASFEVSGELLERWLLKALVGMIASGNAAKNAQRISKHKPPLGWLQLLYGHEPMPERWGLYLAYDLGQDVMDVRGIALAPLIHDNKFVGAVCHIHGFRFLLAMATPGAADRRGTLLESALYRPAHLSFSHRSRPCSLRLNIKWNSGSAGQGLVMESGGEKT